MCCFAFLFLNLVLNGKETGALSRTGIPFCGNKAKILYKLIDSIFSRMLISTIISLRISPVINKVLCLTCVFQLYHRWLFELTRMCKGFRKVRHRLSSVGKCPSVLCLFILWCFSYWCFWIVVLKKALESPSDSKEINQSILKEINLGYSFKGQMLMLYLQCFSHLMRRANLLKKDPHTGKDRRQEEKGMTEDEMVGWVNGHESEQTPGDSQGQGSLACCIPQGGNVWDMT